MDHSLMSEAEIERRGRVVVDPCFVCSHNRQAHVLEGVFVFEVHGQRLEREIIDACIACTCLEYTSPPEQEAEAEEDEVIEVVAALNDEPTLNEDG